MRARAAARADAAAPGALHARASPATPKARCWWRSATRACCAPRASRTACRRSCAATARAGSPPSTACCRARPTRARAREAARGKQTGRTQEIQRLIGRSLRAVVDLKALGERTITIDCDVLQADGGTRTAAITGGYVALADAVRRRCKRGALIGASPLHGQVAAVSVGIVPRRAGARPRLRRGFRGRDRHERRHEQRRRVHRGPGHRRGPRLPPPRARPLLDLAARGIGELFALQPQALDDADGLARPMQAGARERQRRQAARVRARCSPGCRSSSCCRRHSASPRAEETGATFLDNALLKARHARRARPAAPRSPTIRASRSMRSAARRACARRAMPGAGAQRRGQQRQAARGARAACRQLRDARAIAACSCSCAAPTIPQPLIAEGVWEGAIVDAPRGTGGFGYDPLFVAGRPRAHGRRAARPTQKNRAAATAAQALRGCCAVGGAGRGGRSAGTCRRSRCTCTCPGACASARTATSIPMRCSGALPEARVRRRAARRPRRAGRRWSRAGRIESVFFGGGTPSLFSPRCHRPRCSTALRGRVAFAPDAEITLEANPGTIEHGRFADYRAAGINRVSLGAQSFAAARARAARADPRRRGHAARGRGAAARGPRQFQPGPDVRAARADARARRSRTSTTALGARPGAPVALPADARARHGVPRAAAAGLPDEDRGARAMQRACQDAARRGRLRAVRGVRLCAAGRRCRHNLNYWSFGDYLGIGAGAHGKLSRCERRRRRRSSAPQKRKQPRRVPGRVRAAAARRAASVPPGELAVRVHA